MRRKLKTHDCNSTEPIEPGWGAYKQHRRDGTPQCARALKSMGLRRNKKRHDNGLHKRREKTPTYDDALAKVHVVYALRFNDHSIYFGTTSNLKRRLYDHGYDERGVTNSRMKAGLLDDVRVLAYAKDRIEGLRKETQYMKYYDGSREILNKYPLAVAC